MKFSNTLWKKVDVKGGSKNYKFMKNALNPGGISVRGIKLMVC